MNNLLNKQLSCCLCDVAVMEIQYPCVIGFVERLSDSMLSIYIYVIFNSLSLNDAHECINELGLGCRVHYQTITWSNVELSSIWVLRNKLQLHFDHNIQLLFRDHAIQTVN